MAFTVMYDVMQWVDNNGDPASGFVLKAFDPGTTTPISIFIDKDGSSPQATITFNAEGKPEVSGNEIVPFIDRDYKWAIFRNAADAAVPTNPFAGFYDNIPQSVNSTDSSSASKTYLTLLLAVADAAAINIGDDIYLIERATGDGGGAHWEAIASTTNNGVDIVDTPLNTAISLQLIIAPIMDINQFGAIGDGDSGKAAANNSAILRAMAVLVGKKLLVPKGASGAYMVDAVTNPLLIPSDSDIEWLPGAEFEAITNDADNYDVMKANSVSNITLTRPKLTGERTTHTGSTGESGHCLQLLFTTDVHVIDPILSDSWGDGLYISDVINNTIDNPRIDNCRRNGITVISADGLTINKPRITDTSGTNPQAGIDIEPNLATQLLRGIVINDPYTSGGQIGVSVVPIQLTDAASEPVDVIVNNHTSVNDNRSIQVSSRSDVKGTITFNNPYSNKAVGNGILLDEPNSDGPKVVINDPVIIDNNTQQSTSNSASAGILIFIPVGSAETYKIGNVEIVGPSITSTGVSENRSGIYTQDARTVFVGYKNIKIIDPKAITTFASTLKVTIVPGSTLKTDTGIEVRDTNEILTLAPDGTNTIDPTGFISRYSSVNYTGNGNLNLSDDFPIGYRLRVDVEQDSFVTRVIPTLADALPFTAVVADNIDSIVIGSTMTFEKFSSTSWRVINLEGTWT